MHNDILDDGSLDPDLRGSVEYAGFGVRILAGLLDFVVMIPVMGLSMYNSFSIKSLPIALGSLLLVAAYKPLLEYYYGATVGKMVMKLLVVDRDFQEITLDQAIMRYSPWLIANVVSVVATIILYQSEDYLAAETFMDVALVQQEIPIFSWMNVLSWIPIISAFIMLFNDKHEAGHDQLAKTYCIRKSN